VIERWGACVRGQGSGRSGVGFPAGMR